MKQKINLTNMTVTRIVMGYCVFSHRSDSHNETHPCEQKGPTQFYRWGSVSNIKSFFCYLVQHAFWISCHKFEL